VEGGRQATLRGVLFTDMVGSTELRSQLGDDRADVLRRDIYALLGSAVAANGGRVLRWTGDGIKADFPTASGAITAAMAMQRGVAAYGTSPEAVAAFQIRVGVSVGEVVVEGNEAHGIAVVEAARLEPLAEPGQILVTALARRLGERRVEATFEETGEHTLKGLDEPVAVVRVVDGAADAAARPFARALTLDQRFPLVGRSAELTEGLQRWHEARAGSTSTMLVSGPAGIGKSRLVAQIAERAHSDGALVLAGSCDSDLALPYQPFVTAFAAAAGDDAELAAALDDGAGALGPLFPSRRQSVLDDPGPSARYELFQAVVALVGRLAQAHPLVLALDDLHWATASTIQLIRHLVDQSSATPLLVLGTYRGEELQPGHPLRELVADHRRSDSVATLELAPLARADVAELVTTRVPYAPAERIEAFTRRLYEESAGSPFFTCELLDHLTATGELAQLIEAHPAEDLPIPDSVRDVVDQRLARLADGSVELLSTAAVIGARFDIELLAAVRDQGPDQVVEACEEVGRLGLVQEVDAGGFAFSHAIVRGAVLDRLSATRQALTHRHVAEAIETLGRADHDELAHHWRLAGVEDRANQSLERAAERDLGAFAFESAVDRYAALLAYHRDDPTGDARARARAWLGHGLAKRALGETDYLDDIGEAARLGRRMRDADILAEAAVATVWPGNFFQTAGRVDTPLVEVCEDALGLMGDEDPRRARVLATLAAHLTFDGDLAHRRRLLTEADDLARRTGEPELVGGVLLAEYLSLWNPTTVARRAEIAKEVDRLARASGDPDLEFFGGFFTAIGATEQGDLATARTVLAGLGEAVTATQNAYYGFLAERLDVSLDVFTSRPEAQVRIDELAQRYESHHADTTGTWSIQTGSLALHAGTLGELVPTVETLVQSSDIGANWTAAHGFTLLLAGDRSAAAAVLDAYEDPPLDYLWITTLQTTAEVAVGLGRRDLATRLFEQLLPHRGQVGITASGSLLFGQVSLSLGQLALSTGELDTALELLDESVDRAAAMGAPFETVKARRLLGTCLRAMGRAEEATPVLDAAAQAARAHGFAGELRALDDLVST
jgi:class 3 adenylate cyclase/tetratricopeptide (TPR) repeat protein